MALALDFLTKEYYDEPNLLNELGRIATELGLDFNTSDSKNAYFESLTGEYIAIHFDEESIFDKMKRDTIREYPENYACRFDFEIYYTDDDKYPIILPIIKELLKVYPDMVVHNGYALKEEDISYINFSKHDIERISTFDELFKLPK